MPKITMTNPRHLEAVFKLLAVVTAECRCRSSYSFAGQVGADVADSVQTQ